MNPSLRAILLHLLNRKYIGGKHAPEQELVKSRTKWVDEKQKKEFHREYKEIINQGFVLRSMKRTGKGSEWHISLNPRKLKELFAMLEDENAREDRGFL
jgi:hypothetical protein